MIALVARLPEDCLVRTTPESREVLRQHREWPVEVELLAQLIEEVSILVAERRRRRPREVPRPDYLKRSHGAGIAHAIGVLKQAAQAMRQRRQ